MLEPIQRNSLTDQVFAQLRDQIVSGERAPGDALPSERVLADALGINRGAVREALRQLVQARLIAVKQGGASRVLDFRETAGIELLGALVVDADGTPNPEVVRSILEMRSALAPAVAAAAARNGGTPEARTSGPLASLGDALESLAAATSNAERAERSRVFWGHLIDGSNNIAYRLAYNSLNETSARLDPILGDVMAAEFSDLPAYRALADAVLGGDADAAATRAAALVGAGERAIGTLLALLDG